MPYYPGGFPEYGLDQNGQPRGYAQGRPQGQAPTQQYQNAGRAPYLQQHPVVMISQEHNYNTNSFLQTQQQPHPQYPGGQQHYRQPPVQHQQQHQPSPYAPYGQLPPHFLSQPPPNQSQHHQLRRSPQVVPAPHSYYPQPVSRASQPTTRPQQGLNSDISAVPIQQPARTDQAPREPTGAGPPNAISTTSQAMDPSQHRPQPMFSSAWSSNGPQLATPHRQLAHVQIPVQRSNSAGEASQDSHQPPSKRKRSNDGRAMECNTPMPPPQGSQKGIRKQEPPASSPLTDLQSSQIAPTPPPPPLRPSVDEQAVLLALADEYLDAARRMGATAIDHAGGDHELYCRFLATAIGCLESALHNFRHDEPRKEARLRLKLATLMFEETENRDEAQELLTKGIPLCDRANLLNCKYAMQHLSVRITAKDNPKAAMRYIDRLSKEVEALILPYWVYSFRLLRVSFSLESGSLSETAIAVKNLTAVSEVAGECRHIGIQVVAAALETLFHVRSGTPESLEHAQRSLAAARTHQLSPETKQIPQLQAFVETLDLVIALQRFDNNESLTKLGRMQQYMEDMSKHGTWNKDGSFSIPIDLPAADTIEADTNGTVGRTLNGHTSLPFQWYAVNDVYSIGFIMSALANFLKNSSDGKAEKYLQQGLKICQNPSPAVQQGVQALSAASEWRHEMRRAMRCVLVSCYCSRGAWDLAAQTIADMEDDSKRSFPRRDTTSNNTYWLVLKYLRGVVSQGQGELEQAMEHYSDTDLELSNNAKMPLAVKDVQTLAALNKVLILRSLPDASDRKEASALLTALEPHIRDHRNHSLHSCYNIIRATAPLSNTTPSNQGGPHIIKTKQYLQAALQAAQTNKNQQLLSVIMNVMSKMFFTDIVGDQAEKSTRAGRTLANKTRDSLWIAVADGMFARTLERAGRLDEAASATNEGLAARDALPAGVKMRLGIGD